MERLLLCLEKLLKTQYFTSILMYLTFIGLFSAHKSQSLSNPSNSALLNNNDERVLIKVLKINLIVTNNLISII